jgi:hypothetical protein
MTNTSTRRPWRRCAACRAICHWHETHWVCDGVDGCGSEWDSDHAPKYCAPEPVANFRVVQLKSAGSINPDDTVDWEDFTPGSLYRSVAER